MSLWPTTLILTGRTLNEGPLAAMAEGLSRYRLLVLALILSAAALLSLSLPKLGADFTPSDLFASFDDQKAVAAAFEEDFGNTNNVILLLIESSDVFELSTLQYLHDLSRQCAQRKDLFESAQSLTITPVPRRLADGGGDFDASRLDPKVLGAVGFNPMVLAMMAAAPTDKNNVNIQRLLVEIGRGRARVDALVEGERVTGEAASEPAPAAGRAARSRRASASRRRRDRSHTSATSART